MNRKLALPRGRSSSVLIVLTWVLASLATAALSHAVIGVLGALGAGGDAYDEHDHASVAPVVLGALSLIAMLLLRSAALRLSRTKAIDPALLLAQRFGTMPFLVPAIAVSLGGFATLLGMEFSEQFGSLGRVEGVAEALGGNSWAGLSIIVCVALAVTIFGLRSARGFLLCAAAAIGAVCAWIVVKATTLIDDAAILRRALRRHRRGATSAFLAQCRGLRAPPPTVV